MKQLATFWAAKPLFLWMFLLGLPLLITAQGIKMEKYNFGEGIRFVSPNAQYRSPYRIELSGYVQPYAEMVSEQNDAVADSLRFRMRRLRIRLSGSAAQQKLTWRLQFDLSGNSETNDATNNYLMDAWVGYQVTDNIRVRFGQKNTPTDNLELQLRSHTLQMVERSRVTSAFSTIREFGLFIDGTFKTGVSSRIRPAIAITNGDGANVFDKDFGGLKYGGRIDWLPFGTFVNMGQFQEVDIMRELTPKLLVGAYYSLNKGVSSRRGRASGSILYLDEAGNYLLPDFTKFGFDFMLKYKGFSALGEFVKTSATVPDGITQRVRNDGSTSTSFTINNEQNVENYIKNRMMLGTGFNIQAGYLFKSLFSVDVRYTQLTADEFSFLKNLTFYNQPKHYTLAVSKYAARNYGFKIQASVTYAVSDADPAGAVTTYNDWIFRLITSIAF